MVSFFKKLFFKQTVNISVGSEKPIFSIQATESKRRLIFIPQAKGPKSCEIVIRNKPNDVLFVFYDLEVNKKQIHLFGQDIQTKKPINLWTVSVKMLCN